MGYPAKVPVRFFKQGEYVVINNKKYALERTCRNLGGEEGTNFEHYDFGCSDCGYCCDLPEPNYCPNCSARVID